MGQRHLHDAGVDAEDTLGDGPQGDFTLAFDDVMGQGADGLLVDFVADLGAADDDDDVRRHRPQDLRHLEHEGGVPDVDAQPHQTRAALQDGFDDIGGAVVDGALEDRRTGLQGLAQVRLQVAQGKRGVGPAGIERHEDDVGLADFIGLADVLVVCLCR